MARKWKVWKRDGAWWVLDERGRLRYASGNHMMALSFALMQSELQLVPYVTFTSADMGKSWNQILKELWQQQQINDALNKTEYDDDPEEDHQ